MNKYRAIWLVLCCIALEACAGNPSGEIPSDIRVFQADELQNRQINFVWIEIPRELNLGSNTVRVFMARTNPPGMLVPTETELPCIVPGETEYLDLRPLELPFEFDGKQLTGSYTWNACATCIECYMDWDTTMEISAVVELEQVALSIGIRHMGHNIQDNFVQFEVQEVKPSAKEPSILCRRSFDCKAVELAPRR